MGRLTLLCAFLLSAVLPIFAHPQQQEPLGDVARQVRAEKEKGARRATKVFTNDNLPAPNPLEPVSQSPPLADEPAKTAATSSLSSTADANNKKKTEVNTESRDYWQDRFKSARRDLAKAKEQQQLSEDELNLLQIQQVRELNADARTDLTAQVEAKQSEVNVDRATTEAAKKALDDLENEFKESGARLIGAKQTRLQAEVIVHRFQVTDLPRHIFSATCRAATPPVKFE
jgi:hypothetical protein